MNPRNFDTIMAVVNAGQEVNLIHKARSVGALGGSAVPARGTVSNEMLDMLGIEDKQRCVVQMIARSRETLSIMASLHEYFQMRNAGNGIIFTVPVPRSKGLKSLFRLRDEYRTKLGLAPLPFAAQNDEKKEPEEDEMDYAYEMLQIIVKSGFADEAMEAAKAAGAEGGTILHGRGIGIHENVKLFGVAIEPEKDILMILVKKEIAEIVMNAIAEKVGLNTPGRGIAFSMPVGHVMGIVHEHKP